MKPFRYLSLQVGKLKRGVIDFLGRKSAEATELSLNSLQ